MTLLQPFLILGSVLCLWISTAVFYNLVLHPLARYPGPKLWAATRLTWCYTNLSGRLPHNVHRLHKQYGHVVRVAPDELSIISPSACNDIYGHVNGKSVEKDPNFYIAAPYSPVPHILVANDAFHARYRRAMAPAFSDKAIREQHDLLAVHVRLLVQRLHSLVGETTDMVRWYNYATFDIIGDLMFGESFGCLESSSYNPWVALIFKSIKNAGIYTTIRRYIPVRLLTVLAPKSLHQKRRQHTALTKAKLEKRLAQDQMDRPDFLSYILRHDDEKGMTKRELIVNSNILIMAGSETTATALSGVSYFLMRNPDVMNTLTDELRQRFRNEDEMTQSALVDCDYLNLVLKEGLRMYPPVALTLPRRVTAAEVAIGGQMIPRNTIVGVPQLATHYSSSYFGNPNKFDPSRWIQAEKTDGAGAAFREHTAQVFNPFSLGTRNCIGQSLAWMEMRLILANVLFNFDMELLDDAFNPEGQAAFVLWEKPALSVKLSVAKR